MRDHRVERHEHVRHGDNPGAQRQHDQRGPSAQAVGHVGGSGKTAKTAECHDQNRPDERSGNDTALSHQRGCPDQNHIASGLQTDHQKARQHADLDVFGGEHGANRSFVGVQLLGLFEGFRIFDVASNEDHHQSRHDPHPERQPPGVISGEIGQDPSDDQHRTCPSQGKTGLHETQRPATVFWVDNLGHQRNANGPLAAEPQALQRTGDQ
ncbi:hypothetical protein D3C86_1542260 [compost metagenome]